ncbi:hypothetical protein [Stappia sp.]|uniref:hypothetical protein n=1 Tax=Stappia sp. TaxID=1870903 RepID=UPI0032D9684F
MTLILIHTIRLAGRMVRFFSTMTEFGVGDVLVSTTDLREAVTRASQMVPQLVKLQERYTGVRERLMPTVNGPESVAHVGDIVTLAGRLRASGFIDDEQFIQLQRASFEAARKAYDLEQSLDEAEESESDLA